MKRLILILTMALTSTACSDFNPDLSYMGDETGSGTEGETDSTEAGTDDSGGETDTMPDMGSTGGEGDTDTGSTEGEDPPECGNGIVEEGEECDLEDLNGESCETQGFPSGTLLCLSDCTLWTDECHDHLCSDQPEQGDFSPCEFSDVDAGETCGDPDLYCVVADADNYPNGFCSRECTLHTDCHTPDTMGCGMMGQAPLCNQGRCVIQCQYNSECPSGMTCGWSQTFNGLQSVCM